MKKYKELIKTKERYLQINTRNMYKVILECKKI